MLRSGLGARGTLLRRTLHLPQLRAQPGHFSACLFGDFDGSMVWVDLQAYTDPLRAVALALGGPPDSGLDHVCQLLVGWPSLLVLDNAEHVTRAVERLTFDLQRALPDLRILITSRIRLSMAAAFIDLKPLRVPEHDDPDHVIEQNASVQLLRDALADLAPTARLTRDELLQICDLCGGLPRAWPTWSSTG